MKNLGEIIGVEGLKGDEKHNRLLEIGELLFPAASFPVLALKRVLRGERGLDPEQTGRLTSYLEANPLGKWKVKTKKGTHFFETGEYKAELDLKTQVTKIFHKDTLFHKEFKHKKGITLKEYLGKLDLLIQFNNGRAHTKRFRNKK